MSHRVKPMRCLHSTLSRTLSELIESGRLLDEDDPLTILLVLR